MTLNNPKRRKFYTFVVVPHDANGKTYSIKLPQTFIKLAVLTIIAAILVVSGSVIYSSWLSRRMINYYQTLNKNQEQQTVINNFSRETTKVQEEITELVKQDNELRKTLGLKNWTSKIKLNNNLNDPAARVSGDLKLAKLQLAEKRQSLKELKTWVGTVQKKLASTPAGWPIHGAIMSYYGYRTYPWRGMHTGLDIEAHYGAPVRATAVGVVSYAGWRQGYGKTLIVKHAYNQSTLFAHLSNFAVSVGQKITKGQVVAYVGTTGNSTGPHLHYEVRRADSPMNPYAFLNLNLLSACRLWSD